MDMITKRKMLIVDDVEVNRAILNRIFEEQYEVVQAEDGEQAIECIDQCGKEFVIILLDLIMPNKDGFDVLRHMRDIGLDGDVPVIIITADAELEHEKMSYEFGVSDVIKKPFNRSIVMRRVKNIIDLYDSKNYMQERLDEQEKELLEKSRELKENNEFLVDALSSVVEFRSAESGTHIQRIKYYTRILLEAMRKYYHEYKLTDSTIERIEMASALHDIGKVGIRDEILLKPGKLTKEEFEIMKTHSALGGEMIEKFRKNKKSSFYDDCYDICMYHHERWDGRGYPEGLVGDAIPLSAQVVSIADVFDALVSKRVYKDAYAPGYAFDMINNGECGVFSPKVLECFNFSRADFLKMVAMLNYSE